MHDVGSAHVKVCWNGLLGLNTLEGAAMLGGVIAVGVASLAGVNVVQRFYMECTHKRYDIVLA